MFFLNSEVFTSPENEFVVSCKPALWNSGMSEHKRVIIIWLVSLEAPPVYGEHAVGATIKDWGW